MQQKGQQNTPKQGGGDKKPQAQGTPKAQATPKQASPAADKKPQQQQNTPKQGGGGDKKVSERMRVRVSINISQAVNIFLIVLICAFLSLQQS